MRWSQRRLASRLLSRIVGPAWLSAVVRRLTHTFHMPRTIGLYPENRYTFRTNESFRQEWSFLPDNEKMAIIATQLTYLAFHGWLKSNLRHALQEVPEPNQWSELVFDVDEGFHRTDLLLFASICEAALNCVLGHIRQGHG